MRTVKEILSYCDHTLLSTGATWAEIRTVCDDGIAFGAASVCIPPSYVKRAKDYVGTRLSICTVIGFPNGYSTTAAKVYETRDAVQNGADEIDMVINVGMLKNKMYGDILDEIRAIRAACGGKSLKVIIETCLLSDDEKVQMCKLVADGGADFIKTSTGFSSGGATLSDIALMRKNSPPSLKIKAAGGISSLEDAENFIAAGADRLGTSRIVKIIKGKDNGGY